MSSAKRRGQARGNAPEGSGNPGRGTRGPNPGRGRVAPFDGPASRGSAGSGGGSQSQATALSNTSRPPSQSGSQVQQPSSQSGPQAAAQAAPIARDPAREGPAPRATDGIKNVDMPASFYNVDGMYSLPTQFVKRPGFNTTGKQITMNVNAYQVTQFPQKTIYQYDVIIGSGAEKRVVQRKAWQSQQRLKATNNAKIIWDGNKLAWSLNDIGQVKVMVDLDEEEGKGKSKDGRNAFRVHITPTKKLDLSVLQAYMDGKVQWNTNVIEAINFLDHLLREGPSQNPRLVPIKRSFFARDGQRMDLGGAVEVFRGVYQSMRPVQGQRMIVNLDVAISSFWKPQGLLQCITEKNRWRDVANLLQNFQNSDQRTATKKYLKRLSVKASYPGNLQPNTVWKIEDIAKVNSNTHMIAWRDQKGQETGEKVSVTIYFKRKYNVTIRYPTLPLIEMTKKFKGQPVYFPMELLVLVENQRYAAKLDDLQTASMIKFAVGPPADRQKSIQDGKAWLQWDQDEYLRSYGLTINPTQMTTQARILPAPGIAFGPKTKVEQPGTKGRWNLANKQFATTNPAPLKSWAIGIFPGRNFDKSAVERFALDFCKAYRNHGGTIESPKPYFAMLEQDPAKAVAALHQGCGNQFNARPQILIFVVHDKNAQHYLRIKKSCDCRFGCVSQVMQSAQVMKANPQYISNVLMKVNAKLGGSTSTVVPHATSGFKGFKNPTLFIGADVSHASPGSDQPSMAALTVSYDTKAARYAAGCQTNGRRVEMITKKNIESILGPLIQNWMSTVAGGRAPSQVYYMRDGVSEGQFVQVMQEEVPHIKGVLNRLNNNMPWKGTLTVIVASKRHHIRAFPKGADGDAKGNPLPGTLIEKDVTTPQEFDFYLYSHIALQGTSRPVHYTVLHDEANHPPSVLQNMIYEHCYQYMRSTTSVSLHPAVYYAHLASNRAKAHEDIPAAAGPQGGAGYKQNLQASSDTPRSSEVPPLIAFAEGSPIRYSMWYI